MKAEPLYLMQCSICTHYSPSTFGDEFIKVDGGLPPVRPELPPYTVADAAMSLVAFGGGYGAMANASDSASGPVTQWANEHRDVINYELEAKLRRAGYQPHLDPDRISGDEWLRMGVGAFSVAILRDLWKQRQ